ncbi:MAG: 16S rRNA (cytidine(1402)-2'-O)-methyltransferase [Lentisphaerae bacterium RIFOXYC12_FULL_60_16]|nr:MAG: 16S rRNA (cytidine(1402)-2'-O)-methyltransferase [Lentisphaerae bacterium RIFOXYC12_FULL_60_16]OGV72864.1 MAG: 16S rRNA (cytidine(1402)-2'-O)-methyltransferase [Lentisphaerae bacterium RIFOXYA12_FULL_60_10]OGV86256.1 MAG: 16S rRNA (cytidine(1402)-2'-O)-methyltransferase [Lentisphaerae bacterium RIFOXYB12_FULL_60_10]
MLYVIGTPIGNLQDLSPRAIEILKQVQVLACEDTRRTRQLLAHFNIPVPRWVVSYREHREASSGEHLLAHWREGHQVALCSDGGMPSVSDPGYRLVRLAVENSIPVVVIPGPSAVLTALVVSGLPTSSFTFKGYPPRKPGPLRRFFESEASMPHTLVVFESPYRVGATLAAAYEALGNRQAAVCLELTKHFERVERGSLETLAASFAGKKVKGEATLVIAGNHPKFTDESDPSEPDDPSDPDVSDPAVSC